MEFTKEELLKYAKPSNVDVNKSANFMSDFGLADRFGGRSSFETAEEFLDKVQSVSVVDLSRFVYKEPKWVLDEVESSVEKAPEASVEEVDVVVPQEEVLTVELIPTEVVVEEKTLEVDWEWVDSLEDSPENRLALDEYAEKFSVKLKRTMKVENMAKKFKEALA